MRTYKLANTYSFAVALCDLLVESPDLFFEGRTRVGPVRIQDIDLRSMLAST